jgi:hypothetical protein
MRSRLVVIMKARRKHAVQVTFPENDDVIESFAAERANDPLGVGVLPG